MSQFEFEIFGRPSQGSRGLTVTVNCRGYLSLSPDAFTRLGSPRAVRYLIDKNERVIGFQPCKPREEHAHAVSQRAYSMCAVSLLKYMGVPFSEGGRRYDLQVADGVPPYIDLKRPGVPVTSNRRKASRAPGATAS
jgi:hypothetical protein